MQMLPYVAHFTCVLGGCRQVDQVCLAVAYCVLGRLELFHSVAKV